MLVSGIRGQQRVAWAWSFHPTLSPCDDGSVDPADLSRDPDLDDLPPELAEHPGPLYFGFIDPESGAVYPLRRVTRAELASIMADARRRQEDESA